MYPDILRPGDVVHVDGDASVQFQGQCSMTFRVIRVDPRSTYDGWLWLEGYVLGPAGNALQRRRIFVRRDGLHPAAEKPAVEKKAAEKKAIEQKAVEQKAV